MSEKATPSVSDAKVVESTGKSLQDWYRVLDDWGAKEKTHKEIAAYLYDEHGVTGWYAQSITVEYERERGLRGVGQACDGDWKFAYTRVVAAEPNRIWEVVRPLVEAGHDGEHATGATDVEVKRDEPANRFLGWGDFDGLSRCRIDIAVGGRPDGKSTVTVDVQKVPTAEEQARLKTLWQDRLKFVKSSCEG